MTQMKIENHKPLVMPADRDAFLEQAFAEPDGCLSVGGLTRPAVEPHERSTADAARLPLARLVELARRKQGLTVEQLAGQAEIDLGELLAIENGEDVVPQPRTLHRLASFFKLKVGSLMELAGAATARQTRIGQAALRFAARSEPMGKLSPEEERALNEFVEELSR